MKYPSLYEQVFKVSYPTKTKSMPLQQAIAIATKTVEQWSKMLPKDMPDTWQFIGGDLAMDDVPMQNIVVHPYAAHDIMKALDVLATTAGNAHLSQGELASEVHYLNTKVSEAKTQLQGLQGHILESKAHLVQLTNKRHELEKQIEKMASDRCEIESLTAPNEAEQAILNMVGPGLLNEMTSVGHFTFFGLPVTSIRRRFLVGLLLHTVMKTLGKKPKSTLTIKDMEEVNGL